MPQRFGPSGAVLALCVAQATGLRLGFSSRLPRLFASTAKAGEAALVSPAACDVDAWRRGFTTPNVEDLYELDANALPKDLEGTYFKNGHAKFVVGEDKVMHPFDADGMVAAVTVADGQAFYRNKYVRTQGFKREAKRGKICFRGTFGTPKSGGLLANIFDLRAKNVANTHVLWWGNRLFALWEGGKPHKLDPASLSTFGESVLGGALRDKDNFAAHYKVDRATGHLCNFCVVPGASSYRITTFEFAKDFELLQRRDCEFPGFGVMHDMAITERFFVFMEAPVKFDPIPFVLGRLGPAQCIDFDGQQKPSRFHLIPRDGQSEPITVEAPAHFNFHIANGFENADGNVVIDEIAAEKMVLGEQEPSVVPIWETVDYAVTVPKYLLKRYTLDPKTARVVGQETLCDEYLDFPVIHPDFVAKPYRFVWAAVGADEEGVSPLQGLMKLDLETKAVEKWLPERHEFLSEPCFAPRKLPDGSFSTGEQDGYILSFLLNGRDLKSDFVVFDAEHVSKGPVARIPLKDFIPHGLHGTFVEGLSFDIDKAKRASKLFLMAEKNRWNEVRSDFSGLGANMMFD